MASQAVTRLFDLNRANLLIMPDPKQGILSTCVQLARSIAADCPQSARQCDQLIFWLDVMDKANGLQNQSYESPRDYSQCPTIYDAVVACLKAHDGQMRESALYEALIAGNAPKSKLAGFMGNFRRALSNKERTEIETVKSEGGKREDDVIRLNPETAKLPPKKVR